ncbi:MAG: histidine kinase [Bacillota bacterium]
MLVVAVLAVLFITIAEAVFWVAAIGELPGRALWVIGLSNGLLSALVAYHAMRLAPIRLPPGSSAMLGLVPESFELLRQGLNSDTASKAARILDGLPGVRGVLVADLHQVLGLSGIFGRDEALSRAAFEAVKGGGLWISRRRRQAQARRVKVRTPGGPVRELFAVPLSCGGEPAGFVAVAADYPGRSSQGLLATLEAAGRLFSMQMDLGQLDRQARLAAEAELKALRAQINPHFLFNALHTVVAYIREDPETARRLLIRLADMFRLGMSVSGHIIPFAQEYEYIKNYLSIEQARFRDRLKVVYDIDPQVLGVGIPALSVQPLVENAVRHGISSKEGPGTIRIRARLDWVLTRLCVSVEDDGPGFDPGRLGEIPKPGGVAGDGQAGGGGVALANISERLKRLYGPGFKLHVDSKPGHGTRVHLAIPMR